MSEQADKDFDALHKDIKALRSDLNSLSQSLRDLIENKVDHVKAEVGDASDRLKNRVHQGRDDLSGQIEERPFTAHFSAFGIGMILGALLGRKG